MKEAMRARLLGMVRGIDFFTLMFNLQLRTIICTLRR